MAYYDEVYLKRVNQFGNTLQERVQGRMEYEFDNFIKKSVNRVEILKDSSSYYGVLQYTEQSEKETIAYLLTHLCLDLPDGTIINIVNPVTNKESIFLVMHLDQFVAKGHNRYTIIELERKIEWIDDGILHYEYSHVTGSGANIRDKAITGKYTMVEKESLNYIPNKILTMISKKNLYLKKGSRILIEGDVWKVSGLDRTSVPGVCYATLEEDYTDKQEDITYANEQKLDEWTIQSTRGDSINLINGDSAAIDFILYYGNEKREEPISVKVKNKNIVEFKNGVFYAKENGETQCTISLKNTPLVSKNFNIIVSDMTEKSFYIVGSEKIKVLNLAEYEIYDSESRKLEFYSLNNNFSIEEIKDNKIILKGISIGSDKLIVEENGEEIFSKPIEVESIWLEG